ncbi:tRNA (adenosine(37)-N6)-threonylcarbamoyltransferase complex dimerization subunit type 1 TsaB [Natranaerofaba carboxydovora]|uniref:tRNA (adenosine(37)-N6)-threonylcarbamoyltransferase complex dimerization subunit type 1 TsaB n=1 Tax=Natranaerofaba carboxydovora TaxID=2742683 RepID=UPI001F13D880|nr:tRNA (adenosine(37)-N6)-threonylcarbamoyltransferase complex dimerization subunit type 1 TsaB [Natranaerofaba carboxydovora]UMZ74853.1 tRNA threonylcarbamoyladenosine biosynthesis protein TsaB [Natranaerofaba carboxydovora]
MKVLGLDTSTKATSVSVICEYDGLIAEYTLRDKRTHSEKLMPLVDKVLTDSKTVLEELSGISVVNGPGSFTGLRIGIATAFGLSTGYDIPLVGVSSLDVLANQRPIIGLICPVLDARKNEVYTCLYEGTENGVERLWEYRVISLEQLFLDLNKEKVSKERDKYKTEILFTGDGVDVFREELIENTPFLSVHTYKEIEINRASVTARLGLNEIKKGNILSPHELTPIYIRKSEAEKKREERVD